MKIDPEEALGIDTLLQHLGEDTRHEGAIAPAIFQTANFLFDSIDAWQSTTANPSGPPYVYSRVANPTIEMAQRKVAVLEGAEACKLTGSGMGAISAVILGHTAQGAHVVTVDTCYSPLRILLEEYLPRFGVSHSYVSGLCADEVIDAFRPETTVVYLESPSTMVFRLQDIRRIAKAAREKGIVCAVDNTCGTPLFQQPLAIGAEYALHSGSKYFGGHSDLTAGAICGPAKALDKILKYEINLLGSIIAPFPAWLLARGLRTLPLRLRRIEATANEVAGWLSGRAEVDVVHHASLPSYPQRELFLSQMTGSSGLFSFEPRVQDEPKIKAFCEALRLFKIGVSWGGHESLVVMAEVQPLGYAQKRWVVRLSIGLEDAQDLIADLAQAMEVSGL
ncbi:MAG: PLP-dependent transferase [Fimbriimonas ginsengisoli]|uniref:homocysteine desulfhydrase n=1 Tax=Fimbriimonas ginsengisoli TaxID=1005039 RepID=A0A931LSR9_FIMGI|nr:PLP-dependent transferase [Fimbriimonas ginsengisoli]MBI3721239.1 PLP-dependent transferase [Fimbriimonas ginsengisoli]